jgi:hypothetical protein
MLDLQGARTSKPIKRQGPSILFPSTTTILILCQQQPQAEAAKSHPHVCYCRNRKTTNYRIAEGHWTTHHHGNLAMQSCEYLKVTQAKKQRTNILHLRNLRFFKDGKMIEHNDPHLEFSDCISVTFKMQKKDEKNDTVTQRASGDINMCPVRMAAAIVRRIRSYKKSNNNTPISAFWRFNQIDHVTSAQVTAAMKDAIVAIGKDSLHIKKSEIGTHSIRSGAAMAMFLSNCSVCQIMMIGRWSSDAFL